MRRPRKAILTAAVLSWAGVLTLVAITWAGGPADADESRLFEFFLAVAITLTLTAVFTAHVRDPRAAYRLGWDARGRHEEPARVAELDQQRHA